MTGRPVNVAIIGAGYWGPNLIRNFSSLRECEVTTVCDRKAGRRSYVKEQFPGIPITADHNEVLQDGRVDAVVIATPVSTHHALAIQAIQAGKHVFVEKPLAATSEEALEMVNTAERKKRVLATGHIFVYHPAVALMKASIEQGKIGKPCYSESGRVNLGPPASEVDVIWDLAVHDISIQLFLWNKEPIQVTAYGGRFLHPKLIDVAFIDLRFADGTISRHHVSWLSPYKVRRFFVAGEGGSMLFDDTAQDGKLKIIDSGEDSRIGLADEQAKELYYRPGKILTPELSPTEPLRTECKHFLECIRDGRHPSADGHSGLAVIRVLEAAEISVSANSKPVML